MNATLLTISVIAVLLPGAFMLSLSGTSAPSTIDDEILRMSHGVRPSILEMNALQISQLFLGCYYSTVQYGLASES